MITQSLKSKSLNLEELIPFWRDNPVRAASDVLGVELDEPQKVAITLSWFRKTNLRIMGRGSGKSFLVGVEAVLACLLYPGMRCGLIGPSFRQAKVCFSHVENLYEASPYFQQSVMRAPGRTPDSCHVKFKSFGTKPGSYIGALPLGPDGRKIRGERFYRVFGDEAAQIDTKVLNTVVRGFLATASDPMTRVNYMREQRARIKRGEISEADIEMPVANQFTLCSTAYYQYNHLWERVSKAIELIVDPYKKAQRHGEDLSQWVIRGGSLNNGQIPARIMANKNRSLCAFTYDDMSEGFMDDEQIAQAKEDMSDYEYRMEYQSYFPPDSEGFYRRSLLDSARAHMEFGPILEPRSGCVYTIGIDPARTSDNFAIAVYEVETDLQAIRLVRVMAWNSKDFPAMHLNVRKIIHHYDVQWIKMDSGGGGTTIRDLLAEPVNCPGGQKLILEDGFEEHKSKAGTRILAKLTEFSNYQWVHDANYNLLSALQHGRLQISAPPPCGGQLFTPALDDADQEIEEALTEWSSVITIPTQNRMRWDTPTKSMRKDRYSAILLGHDAALEVMDKTRKPKSLAMGFFA